MLNPIFQIQQPYFFEGQQFNPSTLINYNRFVFGQHQYLDQQTSLQREYLKAYLYSRQKQAFYQNYLNSPLPKIESSPYSYDTRVETPIKIEQDSFLNTTQIDLIPCKIEEEVEEDESISQSVLTEEDCEPKNLRGQIIEMVQVFLAKFDKSNLKEINELRSQYSSSKSLLKLFDSLKDKYSSTTKSKEDMMRFTLRKAITFLRDNIRDKLGLTAKAASLELCRKYFEVDEGLVEDVNLENDGELMSLMLPYKKNSRNKTANSRFIKEIFTSEAFYQDYAIYLDELEGILEMENQKKIDKFVIFLEACVRENSFHKIKQFKRLPWLQGWLENTKTIAQELSETWKPSQERSTIKDLKKLKNYK